MKTLVFLLNVGLLTLLPASAATVVFKGYTFTYDSTLGSVVTNGSGSITATQTAGSTAEFDLEIASGFKNASFSYLDNTSTNIDLFQQQFGGLNPRIQTGSAFSTLGQIDYERYSNPGAIENVDYFSTPRVNGAAHMISDAVNPDGSITFTNDGVVTTGTFLKTNVPGFNGFSDTLLRVRSKGGTMGNSVTFTDLSLNNNTVPEPGTIVMGLCGMAGLLVVRKRLHQN